MNIHIYFLRWWQFFLSLPSVFPSLTFCFFQKKKKSLLVYMSNICCVVESTIENSEYVIRPRYNTSKISLQRLNDFDKYLSRFLSRNVWKLKLYLTSLFFFSLFFSFFSSAWCCSQLMKDIQFQERLEVKKKCLSKH